jgi:hypothetical protein
MRRSKKGSGLEQVEGSTEDDPFDTVLVSLTEGLPNRFFLGRFTGDADAGAATMGTWWILLDLAKLDSLWGYVMASISKIEHAPESGIWIGL